MGPVKRKRIYGLVIGGLVLLFMASMYAIASDRTLSVKVRPGDTVSYLCFKYLKAYNKTIAKEILRLNPNIKNINLIRAGDVLILQEKDITEKPAPPSLMETKTRGDEAVITLLQGKGKVLRKEKDKWEDAQVNMMLHSGDRVKTLMQSRMELILDNRSFIRITENTLLHMEKMEMEEKKTVNRFALSIGRLWTKVTRFVSPSSSYNINTPTAISAVYGTTYDLRVDEAGGTEVRVFEGRVGVYNPFAGAGPGNDYSPKSFEAPWEVPGPRTVPGPHEVSREEWTRIIVSQFQKVTLSEKIIPKIISFNPQEAANEDWVRWNLERDRDYGDADSQSITAPRIVNDRDGA